MPSSRKYSACRRFPSSRPCMSVNATTTVSIAPRSTSARSSSRLSTAQSSPKAPGLDTPSARGSKCADLGVGKGGWMTTTAKRPDYLDDQRTLHRLGYAQELFRSMGGFSNFAISFTIISILAGCLTSYAIAFNQGGPVAITWGWLIVGLFCTVVALALGEIASTYPTAGGLYYWSSKLGNPSWGWFTGWFNLVGQIAVTASIGYGCAFFSTALLNLLWGYPNSFGWIFFLYGLIMLGAGLINMFKVPITAALNSVSAWWHMAGVLVIVGILIVVPDHHRSVGYVFGQTINNSGFGGTSWTHGVFIYVFLTGLLMAQYTITGYDASAHMSEETRQASIGAAWGSSCRSSSRSSSASCC